MAPRTAERASRWIVVLAAVTAAVVGWASTAHVEILWDEQVDHDIAVGLRDHPFGLPEETLDASQTRLPMYLSAVLFALTGRDDLALARGISLVAGAATILAAAALANACFGPLVAALSSILLALSPYFLAFARISMTEGDILFSLFATLALLAFVRHLERPTAKSWLLATVLFALALGAKAFAIFLIPVFAVLAFSTKAVADPPPPSPLIKKLPKLIAVAIAILVGGTILAHFSQAVAICAWAILSLYWLYLAYFILRYGLLPQGNVSRLVGMISLAVVTCCVLMPAHLTDPQIAREFLRRLLRWDNSYPLAIWSDHLRLYAGIVLIKLTLPWGILTAAALAYAALKERDDRRWRPCILAFVFYVIFLCLLPLRQSFYLMAVYPMILIIAAAAVVELGRRLERWSSKAARLWMVALIALLVHLGLNMYRAYPHFHLYGYNLIGDRWLGAPSRGYRNLIQTPSDGVASLIRWCETDPRVHRGDRVVSYLWEERIIDHLLPSQPHFTLVRRGLSQDRGDPPPPPSLEGADFVLIHINNLLGYGDRPPDWPPPETLSSQFKVIHTIQRGPLAVAWVYARSH